MDNYLNLKRKCLRISKINSIHQLQLERKIVLETVFFNAHCTTNTIVLFFIRKLLFLMELTIFVSYSRGGLKRKFTNYNNQFN